MERLIKILAVWAIISGALLFAGETLRNWGDWQWWPFWLVDFIAATLFIIGGYYALLPRHKRKLSLVTGAYGFSSAMTYMSFFGHLNSASQSTNGPIPVDTLTIIIGSMFVTYTILFVAWLIISTRSLSEVPDLTRQSI